MRKYILFIVSLAATCFLLITPGLAQSVANYTSAKTSATYASINLSGSAFNSWRNTSSFTQDDNRSDFTNIGFDFWYDGTRYTRFCVSTNGFIDFSTSTADGGPVANAFGYDNTAFTNSGALTGPAIAPFYDDLTAQGGTDALGNGIKYVMSGSAPNRVLTIEWINMAVYGNTSPSLNFQVKLHETTGIIEVNYGTMNQGTFTFSYTMGLNGPTLNATPTAAQLKTLQAANSNTFSNTVQNNLSAMPTANTSYAFTPPVPTASSGSLTFSGVSQSGMTLNWPNWASNEVGYVIYNSTDGINYSFVSQTAANATSAAVTGLLPSTTYYWKVYAVTEGCLSTTPLTGTQATSASGNKISIVTGNWNAATTWSPTGVPVLGDNVTISNGNTVTVNSNAQCNSLTVGGGTSGLLQFGTNTALTMTVNNNLVVNSGATFNVQTTSNVTHTLLLNGNVTNNGNINFATDANSLCNVQFIKNGNQTLSGSGATNTFNLITLNMGTSVNNIMEVTATRFSAPTNFLTLTSGTFKLSTVNAVSITPYTAAATIPQNGGLWLNSATGTINTTGGGLTLYGNLSVSNGTMNIGNAADDDILSSGGLVSVSGGTLNIAGKYYSSGINNLSYFNLSGGAVILPTSGSTNTTIAPFQMSGAGSQFAMSGGSIIIPREGGTGAQNLGFVNTGSTSGAVTGGTLQIGNTGSPASQIMINSSYPVGNLLVNNASVTASLTVNSLSVIKNVIINTGTLTPTSLGITLGGNWTNNGGLFSPGTSTVTFNSTSAQSIFKSGGETFNAIVFNGSGVKTFSSAVTANSDVTINSGSSVDVSTSNYQLSVKGNYSNSGTFNAQKGLVMLNGSAAQTIGGSSTTNFYDLSLSNTTGATLQNAENLIGTLTLSNGTFNTNSKIFTMISTATGTARIAQITGTGNITGNVTVQRYAPGGYTGWALLGAPITSALTYADWNDNFAISCPSCPNGSAGGFLSIYTYDETQPGAYDAAASYIALNGITDPIVQSKGYWVYLGNGYTNTSAITIDVAGTVGKFNTLIPLTRTNTGSPVDDGWNLICNPYPSPIRWSLLKGATANIDNAVYVYNTDLNGGSGGYATYINGISSPAVGAGGIGDTIPICQAFYVHSTGATSLGAQESNKVGGNPTFLKTSQVAQTASTDPLLRLYIDGSGFHDETVLYLESGATNGFDAGYDAYKMRGQDPYAPSVAIESGGLVFQVDGVAPITGNYTIPVRALTGYAGAYTFSADNISSFPQGACITLYDTYTAISTDLRSSTYSCTLSDTTTASRFLLTITMNPLQVNTTLQEPNCTSPNAGIITAQGANSGPWNYTWKDSNGNVIKTSLNKATADTLNNLSGGTYTVEVNTVGMCDNNTTGFMVDVISVANAQFSCADTVDLGVSGALVCTNTSTNDLSDDWNFGDGFGTSTANSPTYNYVSTGVYTVSLISTSSSGCTDTTVKTVVVVNTSITTGINASGSASNMVLKTLDNNMYVLQETLPQAQSYSFKVLDGTGKLVLDLGTVTGSTINLPINLDNCRPGIYFLNIISESGSRTVVKLPVSK